MHENISTLNISYRIDYRSPPNNNYSHRLFIDAFQITQDFCNIEVR